MVPTTQKAADEPAPSSLKGHAMSNPSATLPPEPANNNGTTPQQGEAAVNLAGELLLDLERDSTARDTPSALVRESLFFSLIPSLMDESNHRWTPESLGEAVRRAAESWTDLRGRPNRRTPVCR